MQESPSMDEVGFAEKCGGCADDVRYALRVSDAGKTYKSGFSLSGVTFDLPMGYIMGLIGPNGAGKSTLIKLILNMVHRDSGSIEVLGHDNIADEVAVKEQLGVVFDSSYFPEQWRGSTVAKAMQVSYDAWDQDAFDGYLKRFGLDPRKRIKELSRGMQMKLMLAAALSHNARLLILDEPTSGLDVIARDELMEILAEYIEDGMSSVLFSTHITADLERSADFITYITAGSMFYSGPKDEFTDAFRVVKGGLDVLPQVQGLDVGLRRYSTGFDALVRTEQVARLGGVDAIHGDDGIDSTGGFTVDPATIDDIIRLTNARGDGHSQSERLGGDLGVADEESGIHQRAARQ